MQQKNITGFEREYETKDHPNIKGVQIIDGKIFINSDSSKFSIKLI